MRFCLLWSLLGLAALLPGLALGNQTEKQPADPDEILINRLLAIVKDENASLDQRANACLSLGQRGEKARKAAPAMVKFLGMLVRDSQLYNGYSVPAAKTAEGLGDLGVYAKDAIPLLAKIVAQGIPDSSKGANRAAADLAAATALGKIPLPDAFTALARASTSDRNKDVRRGAIRGLGFMALCPDPDLRAKALVQLEVVGETDTDPAIQAEAKAIRKKLTEQKKSAGK